MADESPGQRRGFFLAVPTHDRGEPDRGRSGVAFLRVASTNMVDIALRTSGARW
jgi:hypothetical protein